MKPFGWAGITLFGHDCVVFVTLVLSRSRYVSLCCCAVCVGLLRLWWRCFLGSHGVLSSTDLLVGCQKPGARICVCARARVDVCVRVCLLVYVRVFVHVVV